MASGFKLHGAAYKRDPWPVLKTLVSEGPFVPVQVPILGTITAATHFEVCQTILKDTGRFAVDARNAGKMSQMGIPFMPKRLRLVADNMLANDDPKHRRLRRLADAPFRRAAIEDLRPAIATECAALLDAMEQKADPDLVRDLARPLPLIVICELLGLPREDRAKFTEWMSRFTSAGSLRGLLTLWPTLGRMIAYLRAEIAARYASPKPGLVSELVHAEVDGERLSEDELVSMIFILFVAGHETTTHSISSATEYLMRDHGLRDAFMSPETNTADACEELLRYLAPVRSTNAKFVREDTELAGRHFKRGDRVLAYLAAANMDTSEFDDPFTIDFNRQRGHQLGFGSGPHICLGLHLARAELQIALKQVFERFPEMQPLQAQEDLDWIHQFGLRGLNRLPVRLKPI